ncbi:DUF1553 domain-containing protein [Planctomicrobium sp. SH661]|uniref:DUF1553 domain-containing protein n=1 Tax=Planctomicrobium sp. SH661 TaxID=3448124 RepID=UPI003F5BD532
MNRGCTAFACIAVTWGQICFADLPAPATSVIDFEKQISPIFAAKCLDCHGADLQESRFRLDRKTSLIRGGNSGEPAIVPGNSAESHLIRLVAGIDAGQVMPPKGGDLLTSDEISLLRAWIDQGAVWPGPDGVVIDEKVTSDHWSFQPLKAVSLPMVKSDRIQTPVDTFILQSLEQHKIHLNPPADRRTLIRRMYLDVLGLPPTPEQVQRYVKDDSPHATDILIEQVLSSPQYGERQARYWLDLVRFAETYGFETNRERPNAWRYRDYVIDSFNADKPYDQFVKEQLAGDVLGDVNGLGFLVAGAADQVKSPDLNLTLMQRQNELDDMINTTSTVFLGLTVGCARCHNHKFDPITQTDYYALQAIFAGVNHGDLALPLPPAQLEQVQLVQNKISELSGKLTSLIASSDSPSLVLIDDHPSVAKDFVEVLQPPSGYGQNLTGTEPGQLNDVGDKDRSRNVSGGRYSWWTSTSGVPVIAWAPQVTGEYRVWLSWGTGFDSHCQDARYVIDRDGNPATTNDWIDLAIVNQQRFANGQSGLLQEPLWSGFYYARTVKLDSKQKILLVAGKTGKAMTADALLLEAAVPGEEAPLDLKPNFRAPAQSTENTEEFSPHQARFVRFHIDATNGGQPCLDELEIFSGAKNVAAANAGARASASGSLKGYPIHQLEHVNDGKYGNQFSWIADQTSQSWVQIEFAHSESIDRIIWSRDREGQYTDRLPVRYRIESSDDGQKWKTIASSQGRLSLTPDHLSATDRFDNLPAEQAPLARSLQQELMVLRQRKEQLSKPPQAYAGQYQQPGPTHRLFRGEPMMKREEVSPGVPAIFANLNLPSDTPEQDRRGALADWLASSENPLLARVIVNRLWQYHFGRGLVETASDFGAAGVPPSHPELLDWLAMELKSNGWSLKRIHRLILASATYQQSSAPSPQGSEIDAESQYLWRYPPRRLEAEPMRDSILAVSGVLDLRAGGPGFSLFEIEAENVRHYAPKTSFGPEEWRRMIYMTKVRMEQDSVFAAFDCPDAATSVPRRTTSTTPLQALNLFNSEFLLQQSDIFAERLQREHPEDRTAQICRSYELCYSRSPSSPEIQTAETFINQYGLSAFCRAILNSNEFLFLQ